jgi:hypothetical protein
MPPRRFRNVKSARMGSQRIGIKSRGSGAGFPIGRRTVYQV